MAFAAPADTPLRDKRCRQFAGAASHPHSASVRV